MNQISPSTKSFVVQWYWMISFIRRTIIQIPIPSHVVKIYKKNLLSSTWLKKKFVHLFLQAQSSIHHFTFLFPSFFFFFFFFFFFLLLLFFKANNKLLLKINNNEQRNFNLLKIKNNEQRNFLGIFIIRKYLSLSKCLCT